MGALEGRLPRPPSAPRLSLDGSWGTSAAGVAAAFVCGIALTQIDRPGFVVGGVFLCAAFILALWKFGAGGSLLFLMVTLPLVPVTEGSFPGSFIGQGRLFWIAVVAGFAVLSILATVGRVGSVRLPTRPITVALAALAGIGVLVAAADASGLSSAVAIAVPSAGQPAFYALVLSALSTYAASGPRAGGNLLGAWCWVVVLEALLVTFELASGSAYDPLRGITRAQGTLGADFLSVFGMLGLFAGLALRNSESGQSPRWLGSWAIGAGCWLMIAAVARGGVVGTLIGFIYLLLRDQQARRKVLRLVALAAALGVLLVAGPVKNLWDDGLGNRSLTSFDRPATWVSGARMARDHPLTGLGSTDEIVAALEANPDYRFTSFGETSSIPHNSLLLALVEGGVLYFTVALIAMGVTVAAIWRRPGPERSQDAYLIAGLLGFGAVACINNLFSHPEVTLFALTAVALVLARPRSQQAVAKP